MLYLLTAGKKALEDGGVTEDVIKELDIARCGVLIGSALGGMKVVSGFQPTLLYSTVLCANLK